MNFFEGLVDRNEFSCEILTFTVVAVVTSVLVVSISKVYSTLYCLEKDPWKLKFYYVWLNKLCLLKS